MCKYSDLGSAKDEVWRKTMPCLIPLNEISLSTRDCLTDSRTCLGSMGITLSGGRQAIAELKHGVFSSQTASLASRSRLSTRTVSHTASTSVPSFIAHQTGHLEQCSCAIFVSTEVHASAPGSLLLFPLQPLCLFRHLVIFF